MNPAVHERVEHGRPLPFLVWRLSTPRQCISSGPLGGGIGVRRWVLNAQVASGYDRQDPDQHLSELATQTGLTGEGIGLMTAVDVRQVSRSDDGGVHCWATVGVDRPSWAAATDEVPWRDPVVGTINLVLAVPVQLGEAALVNAVATATEAKAQAMIQARLDGTGTPTDAVCIICPMDGSPEPYGGPRSRWGAPIARAVHTAVTAGLSR